MNSTTTAIFEKISKAGAITTTTLNGLPGMSSLEIAEITGKRHDNILRDIAKMLNELVEPISSNLRSEIKHVETNYQDGRGRFQPMMVLDKELTFTLLSRYSFKLSNLIVRRWLTLEGSGFERVSVQGTVVQLAEREKDNRQAAFRALKKGPRHALTFAERERQCLNRLAYRNSRYGL
jgi:phage regulator Rha-like protein